MGHIAAELRLLDLFWSERLLAEAYSLLGAGEIAGNDEVRVAGWVAGVHEGLAPSL
jgi:hypothetical protein